MKPETRYRLAVEKLLPSEIYHLKLNLPYAGGIADSWYSAKKDIWIEYKWIPKFPVRVPLDLVGGKDPWISKLQQDWLLNRHEEGRTVAVIVGSKSGGLILPGLEWTRELLPTDVAARAITKEKVAEWLCTILL